jgi:hypothetical protein
MNILYLRYLQCFYFDNKKKKNNNNNKRQTNKAKLWFLFTFDGWSFNDAKYDLDVVCNVPCAICRMGPYLNLLHQVLQ